MISTGKARRITGWFGTVRKAVANALVLTGGWTAAVVDSKPAGITAKETSALIVIWIGVAVVYLTGNDTPASEQPPSDADIKQYAAHLDAIGNPQGTTP